MDWKKIKVVIGREYMTRVKKKSFLFTTFLAPLLFAAIAVLPTIILLTTKEKSQLVAVVDKSSIVMPYLTDSESAKFTDFSEFEADSVKTWLEDSGMDVLLVVSELDTVNNTVTMQSYSSKPIGVDFSEAVRSKATIAVENYRISQYDIEGLDQIMKDVKADVRMTQYTLDDSGNEILTESGIYMAVSMILGMIIFMFITMFGSMVMTSVIEEKSSRVVEVLISSVKSTELMFGKIIGVALVALTQFFLWILLTVAIVAVVMGIFGKSLKGSVEADPQQVVQSVTLGADPTQVGGMTFDLSAVNAAGSESETDVQSGAQSTSGEMEAVLNTLKHLPYARLLIAFVIYFILGYLMYASLFAAIGSAVENEADTQQLQLPVTIPLMIGFFIAFYSYKNPDGALVFWSSMFPLTSPIVMLARIPYGVAFWELAVSILLLLLTFILCAWASAKIYKMGILMFGKKSSWKDLWKWLKQR